MSKLNFIIPKANFEIVRDKIGTILKDELYNQSVLAGDSNLNASVFVERKTNVDRSEGNVINICIGKMTLDNTNALTQRNSVDYIFDIYCNAKDTDTQETCELATLKLHRLIGLVRSILQSPVYNRLDLTSGIVESRNISDVNIPFLTEPDTINTTVARMIFSVIIHEEVAQVNPINISGYYTIVRLEETDKGYEFLIYEGNYLLSLFAEIAGEEVLLNPVFCSTVFNYTITDTELDKITITPLPQLETAVVKINDTEITYEGELEVDLIEGENEIEITVNDIQTYIITINKIVLETP